jgi:hypothetical protein
VARYENNQGVDVMRNLSMDEVVAVSGGEMTCTASLGTNTSVSCTGGVSEWAMVGKLAWKALAASPFTVPGIIERL